MAQYPDGTRPSGAGTVTINSVAYKCDNFQLDSAANTVNSTDENGQHNGAVSFKGPTTGTATLQLAADSTAVPTTAAESSTTGVFTRDSVTYFITQVGVVKPSNGFWNVPISFQKKENA
jgi:hypothetical protein